MTRFLVAIDARPLSHPQAGGFRSYIRALLQGMHESAIAGAAVPRLLLYIDRPLSAEAARWIPPGAETRLLSPSRLRTDWRLWTAQVRSDQPDLVFGTQNYLPGSGNVPTVLVLHDAIGIKRYRWDTVQRTLKERLINRYWHYQTLSASRKARRIITVSQGARAEIRSILTDLPDERFETVYNGVGLPSPRFRGQRDSHTLLCLASPDPRKNLGLLYDALAQHGERFGTRLPMLRVVCASPKTAERTQAMLATRNLSADLLVGLDDATLADAYARATVLVWPSHHEGFGMPPLEMMQTGGAVASSNAVCMPEVLGAAPVYFSPSSPTELADAVRTLLENPLLRHDREEQGRIHAASFTCRRMADETIAVWERVLQSTAPRNGEPPPDALS